MGRVEVLVNKTDVYLFSRKGLASCNLISSNGVTEDRISQNITSFRLLMRVTYILSISISQAS